MNTSNSTENLTSIERTSRFVISTIVIVAAMESSLVGSAVFAAINLVAIALAMTAIIGRDPLKALFKSSDYALSSKNVVHPNQHV